MASHKLQTTELKSVTANELVKFDSNELVDLLKRSCGFDLWIAIGTAAEEVRKSRNIKAVDRLKALASVGDLALKIKRAATTDKSGSVQVNIMAVDPTVRANEANH